MLRRNSARRRRRGNRSRSRRSRMRTVVVGNSETRTRCACDLKNSPVMRTIRPLNIHIRSHLRIQRRRDRRYVCRARRLCNCRARQRRLRRHPESVQHQLTRGEIKTFIRGLAVNRRSTPVDVCNPTRHGHRRADRVVGRRRRIRRLKNHGEITPRAPRPARLRIHQRFLNSRRCRTQRRIRIRSHRSKRDRLQRTPRNACPAALQLRKLRAIVNRNKARRIRSKNSRRTSAQRDRRLRSARDRPTDILRPVVDRRRQRHISPPVHVVHAKLCPHRLRDVLAARRSRRNIPRPSTRSASSPRPVPQQASPRVRRPRSQFRRRHQSRNQSSRRGKRRIHILLRHCLQRCDRISAQGQRPRHRPARHRKKISRSHRAHRRIHVSLIRHISRIHRRRNIRRNRKRLQSRHALRSAQVNHRVVIRLRRQRRVHILHRHRLRRRPRSRNRPHLRQIGRRRRRHQPKFRHRRSIVQLIHHRVICVRRISSRIWSQRHAQRTIRPQRHVQVSRRHSRSTRRDERRPGDDQRPLCRRPIRAVNRVAHRGRSRPALRYQCSRPHHSTQ